MSTGFALGFSTALAVGAIVVYFTGGGAEDAVEKLAGVTERAIEQHEEAAEVTTIATGIFGALCLLALLCSARDVPQDGSPSAASSVPSY